MADERERAVDDASRQPVMAVISVVLTGAADWKGSPADAIENAGS